VSGDENVAGSNDDGGHGAETERPRILLLTERTPGFDSGFGMRVHNTIRGLAAAGELHVCLVDGSSRGARLPSTDEYSTSRVDGAPLRRWQKLLTFLHPHPANVRYRSSGTLRADIERTLNGAAWDLIWCCRVRVHPLTDVLRSRNVIVDFDDVGDRLLRSVIRDRIAQEGFLATLPHNVYDWLDLVKWRRFERLTARRADRIVVCSDVDVEHLRFSNAVVVPNGYTLNTSRPVDVGNGRPRHPPTTAPAASNSLIFVGPLTYTPNRLAVKWLIDRVLPKLRKRIPDAELVIVGDPAGLAVAHSERGDVRFTGWVPDVTPFYRTADVAVTPLHSGGGTRLKVIEALARRVPLVSTSFGCEGLGLRAGEELLVADDPDEFAAACASILEHRQLRQRLIAAGWNRYKRSFTSTACSRAVTELALSTMARSPRSHDHSPESDLLP
jgi:glycosyltransferase involved in cell wall biosynthesis